MSSSNVFACMLHRKYNEYVDNWHTFSNYVTSYSIPYASTVSINDEMTIEGKKHYTSTSTTALKISGRFAP